MIQLDLFELTPVVQPPRNPYGPGSHSSTSGNAWHTTCDARLMAYGFRRMENRYKLTGVLEFDGWFKNSQDLHILAEYKERIDKRTFRELVGQSYLGHSLNRSGRMVVIVLAGHIDESVLRCEAMVNGASDVIYLITNPQHPDSERFLRKLAATAPDRIYSITYNSLTRRIAKHGGFPARIIPERLQ